MKTFFSVDVETNGPNPFVNNILTIGIVVVRAGAIVDEIHIGPIKYTQPSWNPNEATMEWWKGVRDGSPEGREAYEACMTHGEGLTPTQAALAMCSFVRTNEPDVSNAIFVANPATFDHAWIQRLLAYGDLESPFSHRTLCIRNMMSGLTLSDLDDFGESREANAKPDIPHHALSDARAQALDLIRIGEMIRREAERA